MKYPSSKDVLFFSEKSGLRNRFLFARSGHWRSKQILRW